MRDAAVDQYVLYREVGQRIRETRKRLDMTQEALADAVGLTRTSITNIEQGRQKLLLHTLFEIAAVLGVDPGELLPEQKRADMKMPPAKIPHDLSRTTRTQIEAAIAAVGGDRGR